MMSLAFRPWLAAAVLAIGAAAVPAAAQAPASTTTGIAALRAAGAVRCGVNGDAPGFSAPDAQGSMRGLDADFCRAVAAAVFGDAGKVRFERFATPEAGLQALGQGRIDVLARNTTITFSRDAGQPVTPIGVLYYDGQGILARRSAEIGHLQQLDGKRVCVGSGGGLVADQVLRHRAQVLGITVNLVPAATSAAAFAAFKAGQCDAVTGDASALAARAAAELPAGTAQLLPELISQEPLGPWVRGTGGLRAVATWVLQAMLNAEELGISTTTLATMMQSPDPQVRSLLGLDPGIGRRLGLAEDWALQVIRQVGNYGEAFDRSLGAQSGIGLGRGDSAADLLADRRTVAEGAATAPVLAEAARAAGVEMPVTDAVCRLLAGAAADAVIEGLLGRPLRAEGA